MAVSR